MNGNGFHVLKKNPYKDDFRFGALVALGVQFKHEFIFGFSFTVNMIHVMLCSLLHNMEFSAQFMH